MRLMDKNDFLDLFYVASTGQDKRFIKAVEMVVEDTPTIDAVPVVRCKDCRHMEFTAVKNRYCRAWGRIQTMGDDGFCNFGDRKDGDGDHVEAD